MKSSSVKESFASRFVGQNYSGEGKEIEVAPKDLKMHRVLGIMSEIKL